MLTAPGASPLQRLLFPDFFATGLIAAGLTYYNEFVAMDAASQLWINSGGFTAGTTAIADDWFSIEW